VNSPPPQGLSPTEAVAYRQGFEAGATVALRAIDRAHMCRSRAVAQAWDFIDSAVLLLRMREEEESRGRHAGGEVDLDGGRVRPRDADRTDNDIPE
jgi:hypothetical protein